MRPVSSFAETSAREGVRGASSAGRSDVLRTIVGVRAISVRDEVREMSGSAASGAPFHEGERAAQAKAGAAGIAEWARRAITPAMPERHREFYASLPFVVASGRDASGRLWVTALEGEPGFASARRPDSLALATRPPEGDPLHEALLDGGDIGLVGIEFATRRRNRVNGTVERADPEGLLIHVAQAFGNCPQYIHERLWKRPDEPGEAPQPRSSSSLDEDQVRLVREADTFFIGSGFGSAGEVPVRGLDASHRAGAPGFVEVDGASTLRFPDYSGNDYFNTIGNLLRDDSCGLLFIEFSSGRLLHVSGRASVDWAPDTRRFPQARRLVTVAIDAVRDRPGALRLRWEEAEGGKRRLRLIGKTAESAAVTSFVFEAENGEALPPFEAGQHLPIEIEHPGSGVRVERTYSLSNRPREGRYRISVKREPEGLVSNWLHDHLAVGDVLDSRAPAGEFLIRCDTCPVVLVSAGIGITPMVSMLHALADEPNRRQVWFLHATRNGRAHALGDEVAGILEGWPEARARTFYSEPDGNEVGHVAGRASGDHVRALGIPSDAHVFLCGPPGFMRAMIDAFGASGLSTTQIHFEDFGPAG